MIAASAGAAGDDFDAKFKGICQALLQDAKTDAERTRRFHDAAGAAKDKRMQVALLDESVKYGTRSAPAWALNLARKSLDQLERKAPDRKSEWTAKRILLYQRGFRRLSPKSKNRRVLGELLVDLLLARGARCEARHEWNQARAAYEDAKYPAYVLDLPHKDAISRKHLRARHLAGVQQNATAYRQRLAADPKDASARLFLVKTLLVDLNRAAEAAGHLTEDMDEVWRTYLPLAATPLAALKPAACRELGDWFRDLADKAGSPYSKANMLVRARVSYERCLKQAPDDLKAKIALLRVAEKLKEQDVEPVPPAPPKARKSG